MGTWSLRRHGLEGIHEQRKGDRMYKRTEQGWLKHLDFILLDVLCLQLALVLACCIRYGPDQWLYDEALYRRLALWMSVFDVIVAVMFNTMRNVLKRSASAELRYTLAHSALVFGAVVLFLFSTKEAGPGGDRQLPGAPAGRHRPERTGADGPGRSGGDL